MQWVKQVLIFSSVLFILLGCKKQEGAAEISRPVLEVSYMTVKTESVTLSRELPGRTSAYRIAEVRARVDGIVQKRLFEEGAEVNQGEILFHIDPAPYEVELDNAKAMLAKAEASYQAADAQAKRYESLVTSNAVSRQTYDDAVSRVLALEAEIAAGKAAVKGAQIDLDYTRVSSPIHGRIGRAEVTEGAYVRQAEATLMATVQQLDPLYIDLSQSVEEIMHLKEALASGRLKRSEEGEAVFTVILSDGSVYPHSGTLQFSDVTVNPSTGTVTLRGTVPNPDSDLLPGMFVRAKLLEGTDPDAILVPQSLIGRNARGEATLLLVGENDMVELRIVKTARTVGSNWLVSDGLKPGDRIIVNNRQKIRPSQQIKPVPASEDETALN